jgi:fused signal recognition particle receptor
MAFWHKKKKTEEPSTNDAPLPSGEGLEAAEVAVEPVADAVVETAPEVVIAPQAVEEETVEERVEEVAAEPVEETPILVETNDSVEELDTEAQSAEKAGWISRLSGGLSKSSQKIGQGIGDLITKKKLDHETLEALEDILITADLGPALAARLVGELEKDRFGKDITEQEIKEYLADKITTILKPCARALEMKAPELNAEGTNAQGKKSPRVILVCGVNGVGKTTTIGKLAHQMHFKAGKKVALGAADTFRAAAVEQLQIWAERTESVFVSKDQGADAAAVAFESYQKSMEEGADILMIDTAGRLHNKQHLMAELEKIIRVLKKHDENLPHEVLLVLDSTTGQNAITQVETFKSLVNVTGLIVTKLDGSAKGGVVVALAEQFGLPVYAIGVGETVEDLQPFKPEDYAKALVGLSV